MRQVLPIVGTLAAALGWIAPEKVGELTSQILAAAGPVMVLAGTLWSYMANSPKSIIQSAVQIENKDPKLVKEVRAEIKQEEKDKAMGA